MGISKYIVGATLSAASIGIQASNTLQLETIDVDDSRISELCKNINNKSGILLDGDEICEYSIDKGNKWIAIGGGLSVITAIIGIGGIFRLRKRKKNLGYQDTQFQLDSKSHVPLNNNQIVSDTLVVEDGIGIDVIVEAVLWMSIGKYNEAEKYLIDGLKQDKNNIEIYRKLLELYYETKDTKKFQEMYIADEMAHYRKAVSEDDMVQIRAWGKEIDPENPIYKDISE